jgi:hypothetical protein
MSLLIEELRLAKFENGTLRKISEHGGEGGIKVRVAKI